MRDHNRAIDRILHDGRVGETYMVGSGREASIEEIADLVLDTLGKPPSLKQIVPDRPGHDRRYAVDATKIRRELGWAPEDGVRAGHPRHGAVVRREHRGWWEPLRDRAPVVETRLGLDHRGIAVAPCVSSSPARPDRSASRVAEHFAAPRRRRRSPAPGSTSPIATQVEQVIGELAPRRDREHCGDDQRRRVRARS